MFSDSTPDIIAAMEEFRILAQHSQPGISKESAAAERANRDVLEMARSALVQGGLPACIWTEASPRVSFLSNLSGCRARRGAGGEGGDKSPCEMVTRCQFDGASVPFGGE
eukprot:15441894-Alexandrium_andersonii.AAC.1